MSKKLNAKQKKSNQEVFKRIMKKVAIYIRVSTDEQALNGDSIRMQKEELTKWAKKNDYIIYDYYIDDGYTATSLNRPELNRMIEDSTEFDLIIFVKLDRFSRGVANYYKIMDKLKETDTHWKAIFEEYDTTTSNGRLSINIMLSIAENEASVTSDRIKAVFKNKLENGEVITGSIPQGYKIVETTEDGRIKKKIGIDEEKVDLVKYTFSHFEKYGSLNATGQHINMDKGMKITRHNMKKMLRNKLYIGTYVHKTSGLEFPNYCPPIIEKEQFYRVQKILEKNKKDYTQSKYDKTYIFSGILKCACCGARYSGSTRAVKSNNGVSSTLYKRYTCPRRRNSYNCTSTKTVSETKIEQYLIENVRELLKNAIVEYQVEENKKKEKPKNTLFVQRDKIIKSLSKLKDLYMADKILMEEYEKDFDKFKNQLDTIEAKISESKEALPKTMNLESHKDFLSQGFEKIYPTLTDIEKRRLWLSVIDTIDYDGEFNISFA